MLAAKIGARDNEEEAGEDDDTTVDDGNDEESCLEPDEGAKTRTR